MSGHDRAHRALIEPAQRVAARRNDSFERLAELVLAECHPDQLNFARDGWRRVVALVGRGGGKTTAIRARLVRRMLLTHKAKCLYVATTREAAEKLMWSPIKDLFEKLGLKAGVDVIYNESKLRATLVKNGAQLWLFGADNKKDIDKLRGLPFHEVAIDEAASYPVELLRQLILRIIGPRLGDYGGCVVLVGTPGHILQGLFYEASRPGSPSHTPWMASDEPEYVAPKGWSSHTWTLEDGARTVPAMSRLWVEALIEKEANGWSDDHPVWLREYLGLWAADDSENVFKYRAHLPDGTPWNQWDPERVGPLRFAKLPTFQTWAYAYGMDLGHHDPFALNVFAFSPDDPSRTIYHVFGFEKTKMYSQAIAHLLIGENLKHEHPEGVIGQTGWPDGMVADLAGNGDAIIMELAQVYGVRIEAAEKKAKFGAIEVCNGDLIDGRIKILKGSSLETQLSSLQWKQDEFGFLKEDKGAQNHSTDTFIYARRLISNLISAGTYKAPPVEKRDPIEMDEQEQQSRGEYDSLLDDGNYDYL